MRKAEEKVKLIINNVKWLNKEMKAQVSDTTMFNRRDKVDLQKIKLIAACIHNDN